MVILARRVGVKYFIGLQLMLWGGLCMCHAAIRGSGTLIALRLLIGAAEAGFTQIGMFYMSTLYPKYDVGIRVGMFTGMYSVAGAFAGVLAYGLLRVKSAMLHPWQFLFLVEGGITVFLGILIFSFFRRTSHPLGSSQKKSASTRSVAWNLTWPVRKKKAISTARRFQEEILSMLPRIGRSLWLSSVTSPPFCQ